MFWKGNDFPSFFWFLPFSGSPKSIKEIIMEVKMGEELMDEWASLILYLSKRVLLPLFHL